MKRLFIPLLSLLLSLACVSTKVGLSQAANPRGTWALEFSPDDRFFALGGDDSLLYIFNSTNFELVKKYKISSNIRNVTWHPSNNGVIAIATMKDVQLFNMHTGITYSIPGVAGARGIAWNATGELLGVADGYGILHVLTASGERLRTSRKHDTKSYLTMDFSKDDLIATGTDEIILFDTSGTQLSFIDHRKQYNTGVLTVRWHPSGEFFAVGDYGHAGEGIPTNLHFRKKDGSLLRTINGHLSEIRNARWNEQGTMLATASDALRIYNREGDLIATGITPGRYSIWSLDWSKDGKTIITSSYAANRLDVWNSEGKWLKQVY